MTRLLRIYTQQVKVKVLAARLCLTLCDPVDCSPLGSSVHGNLQPRILEWAAMPSSRRSSWLGDGTCNSLGLLQTGSLLLMPPGKPLDIVSENKKWYGNFQKLKVSKKKIVL